MIRQVVFGFLVLFSITGHAENFRGRYFMVIFGYDGPDHRMVDSHTFATFLDGNELDRGYRTPPPTISWLPVSGIVRPLGIFPGRNFSLEETLQMAKDRGYQVQEFGPYEIPQNIYRSALAQISHLRSGAENYKMVAGSSGRFGLNCIHAVSNVIGPLRTGFNWGIPASEEVAQHFGRAIANFPRTVPAVFDAVPELREFAR